VARIASTADQTGNIDVVVVRGSLDDGAVATVCASSWSTTGEVALDGISLRKMISTPRNTDK